ncbi:MAG: hypothetical protein V4674_02685 [Patescibacteria group bacterium]
MKIKLTKLRYEEHTLELVRENGTREQAVLNTKTFLFHDFLHYCVETLADLRNSFWGSLAAGKALKELSMRMEDPSPEKIFLASSTEAGTTEMVVGVLTGVVRGGASAKDAIAVLSNIASAKGEVVPAWCTEQLIEKVQNRMRELLGEWNSLPHEGSMTLEFPL